MQGIRTLSQQAIKNHAKLQNMRRRRCEDVGDGRLVAPLHQVGLEGQGGSPDQANGACERASVRGSRPGAVCGGFRCAIAETARPRSGTLR